MATAADVIEIDSIMAAMVIGRGGATIQNIQRVSGAKIHITNSNSEPDSRKMKITGSRGAQDKALSMVKKILGSRFTARPITKNPMSAPMSGKDYVDPFNEVFKIPDDVWLEMEREKEKLDLEKKKSYPEIKKNFYVEHPDITAWSDIEVRAFRHRKNRISVEYVEGPSSSRPIPKPVKTFEHAFHAFPEILEVIKKQGFSEPSPVQCQAWPIIMSGHDIVAVAETGSGKTLAYILPALIHLVRQPVERKLRIGPSVVILGPTRELVQQIEEETRKYVYDNIQVMSVHGGVNVKTQTKILYEFIPDILIATPGRLNDLISTLTVRLEHVSYLVLDEADRMLDLGFKTQIELALRHVRSDKQTILTSATWPDSVKKLVNYYATNPLHVTVGSFDLVTVSTVRQEVIVFKESDKENWLDHYLDRPFPKDFKLIIFMRKKISVDKLYSKLQQKNIKCRCIHGGRLQADREASLSEIRSGVVPILIATDVASRGLDIKDLNVVINYDFPRTVEEYVHRVGRTGRAGKKGDAITLFTDLDKQHANSLVHVLEKSDQPVPPELYMMINKNPISLLFPHLA